MLSMICYAVLVLVVLGCFFMGFAFITGARSKHDEYGGEQLICGALFACTGSIVLASSMIHQLLSMGG